MVTMRPATADSQSVQDFLKAVYTLQQKMERVSTNALAEMLSISAPSVTDMAHRMMLAELVNYEKYHGVRLTETGEREALRVIRRHRLIELYLVTDLGYALHEVHDEAEQLEHAVSDRFIAALAEKLDHPTLDSHGEVIPGIDGTCHYRELHTPSQFPIGIKAKVACLNSNNPEILQHLMGKGFTLGSQVEIITREPFEGPLTVLIDGKTVMVGYTVATYISVEQDKGAGK
ncbi:MAG: metal-dependent transcriptional regulator [Chloroflexi bacterium]|nr:metal-dependent transcriptional regulator [Chloroflexota bacterium]